jgi:hypothetical protein
MQGFLFHAAEEWDRPHEALLAMALIVAYVLLPRLGDRVFLAAIAGLAARNLYDFPDLANHSNVILFVCLWLLPFQIRRCFGSGGDDERALPTLRWTVFLVYFLAGFHKLNTAFFDPRVSCAFAKTGEYLEAFALHVEDLPPLVTAFVPLSVVLAELGPALAFLWRRSRKYGVLALLLIHATLALVGFADFSSLATALLWLFVPPAAMPELPGRRYFGAMALGFVLLQALLAIERWPTGSDRFYRIEGTLLVAAFVPVWYRYLRSAVPGPVMRLPRGWGSRAFLLFLLFFGMNNYLGLRTAGTLSMFSNLTTEGATSNHLLLGSNPLKLFGFQEDAIELLRVDDRVRGRFRGMLDEGLSIPRVEFARILDELRSGGMRELHFTVWYGDALHVTDDLVHDDRFRFDVPWWQKKLLKFRAIQPSPPQRCAW